MNKAKAIEIINSKDKNATKGLHKALGFDFEKPFHVEKLDTIFTVNKAIKAAQAAGFSVENDTVILLCNDTIMNWHEFNVIRLNTRLTGNYTIEPYDGGENGLTTFFTKCDFEDKRKRGALETYLVCQKSEYILPHATRRYDRHKDYTPNSQTRYKYVEFRYHRIVLKRLDSHGETFDWYGHREVDPDHYNEVVDKSGYCVDLARKELMNRLKDLKTDRRKSEYLQTNNAAKIDALAQLIDVKRKMLVEEFAKITDYEALDKFLDKLGWGRLYSIFYDFADMKKKDRERAYGSIESFERDYTGIMNMIAKI